MATVAALAPPLAVIAPRGLAVVLPLAAAAAAIAMWRDGRIALPPSAPTIALATFLAWAAASALWAAQPDRVWSIWGQIAGVALAGLVLLGAARALDEDGRRLIGTALISGVIVALALLTVEWLSGLLLERSLGAHLVRHKPFHASMFNRAGATLALLVWPAAYVLYARRQAIGAIMLLAIAVLVIAQFESMAAIAGLTAGLLVGGFAMMRPRGAALFLGAALILGTMTAPILIRSPPAAALSERHDVSISIYHRLHIWHFATEAIRERPILGWGLNASRDLPGAGEEFATRASNLPLHPHNAVLQWWIELGAIGAGLGAIFLLLAIYGATHLSPPDSTDRAARAAALALVASGVVVAVVGYGIWQAWWMSTLWLAAILTAAIASEARDVDRLSDWPTRVAIGPRDRPGRL